MVSDPFAPLLGNLAQMGFYKFVLPWLFTMAIVFGILMRSKLFEGQQAVNGLISIVVAFFLVNYTPVGFGLDAFFTNIFGFGILVLVAIFVVLLFMGLVGLKGEDIFKAEHFGGGIGLVLLLALIVFILLSLGGMKIPTETITLVSVLILMIVVVVFIAKGAK